MAPRARQRDEEVAHLQMALNSVFGLAESAMEEAVEEPTLRGFLSVLQGQGGQVMYLLGGFGRAKVGRPTS